MKTKRFNWKKWTKRLAQACLVILAVFFLLEIAYRYQWIDFYKTEFRALNKSIDPKKDNVLVFGDSFTAHPNSYVDQLRSNYKEFNWINCAVPGTGPVEMALMAKRRVKEFQPVKVIYQLYIGNDLLDIEPTLNWSQLSIRRNLYWSLKDNFQVLSLLSRRARGMQSDIHEDGRSQKADQFSIQKYSPRTKMLLRANPNFLQSSIAMEKSMKGAFEVCIEKIRYLKSLLPVDCELVLLVIPHCSQVNGNYEQNFEALGAKQVSKKLEYPFLKQLRNRMKESDVLSPLEFFRSCESSGTTLYFANDPHLNNRGQECLYRYLEKELFENE